MNTEPCPRLCRRGMNSNSRTNRHVIMSTLRSALTPRADSPRAECQTRITTQNRSNYGLFNRNNVSIRSWSWNYRGCWHQTCPPIAPQQGRLDTIHWIVEPCKSSIRRSLCLVAASQILHWAICAPAADRSHGSHLSGSLSGIEPQSPVPRPRQGSPLHYLPT